MICPAHPLFKSSQPPLFLCRNQSHLTTHRPSPRACCACLSIGDHPVYIFLHWLTSLPNRRSRPTFLFFSLFPLLPTQLYFNNYRHRVSLVFLLLPACPR